MDLKNKVTELSDAVASLQGMNQQLQVSLQAALVRIRILERPGSYY
jgi:hypothetical protein